MGVGRIRGAWEVIEWRAGGGTSGGSNSPENLSEMEIRLPLVRFLNQFQARDQRVWHSIDHQLPRVNFEDFS